MRWPKGTQLLGTRLVWATLWPVLNVLVKVIKKNIGRRRRRGRDGKIDLNFDC